VVPAGAEILIATGPHLAGSRPDVDDTSGGAWKSLWRVRGMTGGPVPRLYRGPV